MERATSRSVISRRWRAAAMGRGAHCPRRLRLDARNIQPHLSRVSRETPALEDRARAARHATWTRRRLVVDKAGLVSPSPMVPCHWLQHPRQPAIRDRRLDCRINYRENQCWLERNKRGNIPCHYQSENCSLVRRPESRPTLSSDPAVRQWLLHKLRERQAQAFGLHRSADGCKSSIGNVRHPHASCSCARGLGRMGSRARLRPADRDASDVAGRVVWTGGSGAEAPAGSDRCCAVGTRVLPTVSRRVSRCLADTHLVSKFPGA